jgi:hypothetical protein
MPSLTKSGKPRKVRSDKGTKRGPRVKTVGNVTILPGLATYVKPGRAKRGTGAFIKAGGIFANVQQPKPKRKYTRKPKAEVLPGYVKPGRYVKGGLKLMRSGGIFAQSAKPAKKQSAYNVYVKDNYRLVKSRHPGASSKEVMKLVASQWRSYKGSGYFF